MGNESVYDGKFTTSGFDMDEALIGDAEYDDVISFVVTARVVGVETSETRVGSLKKKCTFKVVQVGLPEPEHEHQMTIDEVLDEDGMDLPDVWRRSPSDQTMQVADIQVGKSSMNDPSILKKFLNE